MVFYLGNFKNQENMSEKVAIIAKKIKRDIRFLEEPMPAINGKTNEEKYINGFGCIAVFDGKKDCSKFWIEFNK